MPPLRVAPIRPGFRTLFPAPSRAALLAGLVAAAALASSGATQAGQDGWTVVKASGPAWQVIAGERRDLANGMTVRSGASVHTGERARVRLQRGTEWMIIGPSTELSVTDRPGQTLSTVVAEKAGSAAFDVEKQNVQHFSVETPMLAALVKGTHFTVSARPGAGSVAVERGTVAVTALKTGETTDVTAGQKASVGARGLSVTGPGPHSPVTHLAPRASVTAPDNSETDASLPAAVSTPDHTSSAVAASFAGNVQAPVSAATSSTTVPARNATSAAPVAQAAPAVPSAGQAPGPVQSRSRMPDPTVPGASGAAVDPGSAPLAAALRGTISAEATASPAPTTLAAAAPQPSAARAPISREALSRDGTPQTARPGTRAGTGGTAASDGRGGADRQARPSPASGGHDAGHGATSSRAATGAARSTSQRTAGQPGAAAATAGPAMHGRGASASGNAPSGGEGAGAGSISAAQGRGRGGEGAAGAGGRAPAAAVGGGHLGGGGGPNGQSRAGAGGPAGGGGGRNGNSGGGGTGSGGGGSGGSGNGGGGGGNGAAGAGNGGGPGGHGGRGGHGGGHGGHGGGGGHGR